MSKRPNDTAPETVPPADRRITALRQAAQDKHQQAVQRAEAGIRRLVKDREEINFRAVARAAGVSLDFLYAHTDLRKRIETLRSRQRVVAVGDAVEGTVVAPPEQGVRSGATGVFPLVGARHPQTTISKGSGHVGRRFGQVLVLHGHEDGVQVNAATGAEDPLEAGPQIGPVTVALLQALRVVSGLLRGWLPGGDVEAQGHPASGYQGELLPLPLDPDAVQRSTEVFRGLDQRHPATHAGSGIPGDPPGGGLVKGPPQVGREISERHGRQCGTRH